MKVVINACFGGFGLSTAAVKRLIELDCKVIECMTVAKYTGGHKLEGPLTDAGDGYQSLFYGGVLLKDGMVYSLLDRDNTEVRSDPVLVQVVEELGDKANGTCADLKVIEIPDNIMWIIEEYDGCEHIAEVHRTWC